MSRGWLWQIFKFEGRLVDVFKSRKVRRTNQNLFGFVRYQTRQEALNNTARKMDGIEGITTTRESRREKQTTGQLGGTNALTRKRLNATWQTEVKGSQIRMAGIRKTSTSRWGTAQDNCCRREGV